MKTEKINKIIESINLLTIETEHVSNEMVFRNVKDDGISRKETKEFLEYLHKRSTLGKGCGKNAGLYIIKDSPLQSIGDNNIEMEKVVIQRHYIVERPILFFYK